MHTCNVLRPHHTAALAILAILAALAVPAAAAQTYDTPQTLVVTLEPPFYTYIDAEGYAVTTGMVHNESEMSYVGNVMILARFYDDTSQAPLDAASGHAMLSVIPPGASSPYAIRASVPDPRIDWAASALLIFDGANPKVEGLAAEYTGDALSIYDIVGAPHTNVTVHLAYHDSFNPPRILETRTYTLGDVPMGGSATLELPDYAPLGARGAAAYMESDVFSGDSVSWVLEAGPDGPPPARAQILDVWLADHAGERSLTVRPHQNATLNAAVEIPGSDAGHWLYAQVTDRNTGEVVYLDRTKAADGEVSLAWTAPGQGDYIAEIFLWAEAGVAVSKPGPALPFSVR